MEKALNYYKNNIKAVNEKLKKLEKVLIYFSILRFIIVILCDYASKKQEIIKK